MDQTIKRTAAFILAVSMLLATAACGDSPNLLQEVISASSVMEESSSSSKLVLSDVQSQSSSESATESESESDSSSSSEAASESYQATVQSVQQRMLSDMIKYYELNSDTVAWLYLPGTTINESVVRNPPTDTTNSYYLRRTNLGVESTGKHSDGWYGCYYTDFRTTLGSRLNLSKNCVIYGHSMTDNPDGVRFAQLNKFSDISFCRTHPYVYFSTIESEMVWQIFAVYYCNVSFAYNIPNPTTEQFYQIIEESRARSFFDFSNPPTVTDKILTLSTCTYNVVDEYPNPYRMVVMAKLIDPGVTLADSVSVSINADHLQPDDPAPTYDLYKNATQAAIDAADATQKD